MTEIEKMAKIINSKCRFQNCNDCIKSEDTCWEFETATALDKAGYRKQSNTVKEFAEKLIMYFSSQEIIVAAREHYAENDTLHSYFQGSRCTYGDAKQKVNEIAASFGEWCLESASRAKAKGESMNDIEKTVYNAIKNGTYTTFDTLKDSYVHLYEGIEALKVKNAKLAEQLKNSVVKQFAEKVNEVIESCERQDGYDAEGSPIYTIDTAILRVEMEQIAEQYGKEDTI